MRTGIEELQANWNQENISYKYFTFSLYKLDCVKVCPVSEFSESSPTVWQGKLLLRQISIFSSY